MGKRRGGERMGMGRGWEGESGWRCSIEVHGGEEMHKRDWCKEEEKGNETRKVLKKNVVKREIEMNERR
ncbi:hypothetical protein Pmani_013845 [Petrolisthes manimaculis]|uniref:Uncharacterized protein n=1 Tax=Petrolisthes manimaculis TaxID=1843537 RepID=A0AAE1UBR3_9EUCA|nr:hypothetical protein Pmani_013845 [Petrolisthes manimaculis]